jgi:pimeloyl-ACP methyl ester carboxylesterase
LLFLHGAGVTAAMWKPQLEALADEFDVAAIDLPGHGSRAQEPFTFGAATAAVEEAVGQSEPALLVGLSLGGYVAEVVAAERSARTVGLILTGCSVDYSRFGGRVVARTGELFQRVWPKRMLANAQRSGFERKYPAVPEAAEAGQYWRGYADALRAARKVHWTTLLKAYEKPVLILNGSRDMPHVRAQDAFLAEIPNGRAELVEGAGHLANLDRPEPYTTAVRAQARSVG